MAATMTGAGGGADRFDPPRARLASPPVTKKNAARRGKSHRGAQERTRGNCSQLGLSKQSPCHRMKLFKNKGLLSPGRVRRGDGNCQFGALATQTRQVPTRG